MKFNAGLCALLATATLSSAEAQTGLPGNSIGKLVACDLIEKNTVEHILGSPASQSNSNRKTQVIDGGTNSICFFTAGRSRLKLTLIEFPTESDAKKVFLKYTAPSQHITRQQESGLGDAAMWWQIYNEQYGYMVRKGKYVYSIDTNSSDGKSKPGLKEKLKAVATSGIRRL